jgi:glyoxylate reductase
MPARKPLVIVTRKLPDAVETRMVELFETRLNRSDVAFTEAEMVAALQQAEVLVPTVTDRLSREILLQAGPQLKLIANYGAGTDHIDLKTAKEKGIMVTNTPSVLTEDTADIAMALILAVPRRLAEGAQLMRAGQWQGWSPTFLLGHRLSGKKLGIIGMGRIGQAVARRARSFGLSLHYHQRKRLHASVEAEFEAAFWPELDGMLEKMDIISLHCPHTPETHHLLDARRIGLLKPDAYVINTARGALIDEPALIEALKAKRLAGVGLDVFEQEPQVDANLIRLPNVLLLPHISSATLEARMEMGEKVLINIRSFTDNHRLPDRVLI